MSRIVWAPAQDAWMAEHGFMEWQCGTCGDPLVVAWTANCQLLDTNDPITPEDAMTNFWQVECYADLLMAQVAVNMQADTVREVATRTDIDPRSQSIATKRAAVYDALGIKLAQHAAHLLNTGDIEAQRAETYR